MAYTFEQLKKIKIAETLEFHKIGYWHERGFKGQGVKILNLESYYSEHGKATFDTILKTSPNSLIDWVEMAHSTHIGNLASFTATTKYGKMDKIEFAEFVKKYDIITVSQEGTYGIELENIFFDSGAILISSAGNRGSDGVSGRFKRIGLSIGAVEFIGSRLETERYSSIGEEVDFATLHYELEGTSFSAPTFAGMCALIMGRYGIKNQSEITEIMKSIIPVDYGDDGHDPYFGWGVPILPYQIELLNGFLNVDNIDNIQLIQDNILNFTNREYYSMIPKYITIHNFGTNDTAENVTRYIDNTDEVKSWHFTVGKGAIYQEMSIYKNGWHSGDGLNGIGNRQSIGIEVEENYQSMLNAIKLCVYLRQLMPLEIKFHNDWSGKNCPRWIIQNIGKEEFIKMIEVMELKFKDVEENRWSYKAIDYVTNLGIMNGFPDGTFQPDVALTREQMAQVLYNLDKINGKV